jgi:hypothetical protein
MSAGGATVKVPFTWKVTGWYNRRPDYACDLRLLVKCVGLSPLYVVVCWPTLAPANPA